jgi:flagellar biogenesis protein FliO
MIRFDREKIGSVLLQRGGLAAWLVKRLKGGRGEQRKSRLTMLDRISLAPRQSLALVEAEGRRFLVATSAEGGPAFYPLDQSPALRRTASSSVKTGQQARSAAVSSVRVSW